MLSTIGIMITSILITLYEMPNMFREKLYKESLVFLFTLSIGTILSVLLALEIDVFNPIEWLLIYFNR